MQLVTYSWYKGEYWVSILRTYELDEMNEALLISTLFLKGSNYSEN